MRLLSLSILASSLFALPKFAQAECWWVVNNEITSMQFYAKSPVFSCGSNTRSKIQNCCVVGDTCEQGSICHFTHKADRGSGYYIAGCTDEDYNDPICSPRCNDKLAPDIVYNQTSSLWACCGPGKDCLNPSSETFDELPPEKLKAVSSSSISSISSSSAVPASDPSTSTNPSSTIASVITVTASQLPSSTSCSNGSSCHSGLSAGAKAGIGIGASCAGVTIIAGILYILLRRSNNTNSSQRRGGAAEPFMKEQAGQKPGEVYGDAAVEMMGSSSAVERFERRREELP